MRSSRSRHLLILLAITATIAACSSTPEPSPAVRNGSTPAMRADASPTAVTAEKPALVGKIQHVSLYPVPNNPKDLAVSLIVMVGNSGAPSTVKGWSLEVSSPNRPIDVAEPIHISGNVVLPGTDGPMVDLDKEDLVVKTATASVPKNSHVRGILTFVLSRTSEAEVSKNNSSLTVHFEDSQGKVYSTPKAVVGTKAKR
jgi:hypothetical protein